MTKGDHCSLFVYLYSLLRKKNEGYDEKDMFILAAQTLFNVSNLS